MKYKQILEANLEKKNLRDRVKRIAQYFYITNRIDYSCYLYIIAKPFYD